MTTLRSIRAAGLLLIAAATPLAAQIPVAGGTLYREFDVGGRAWTSTPADTSLAFFQLYREINSGVVVPNARLWWLSEDGKSFGDVYARTSGTKDQRWRALFSQAGLFRFTVAHDETPHNISSDAHMPGTISATGDSLSLPTPRPDTTGWNTSPLIDNVGFQSTNSRAQLVLTPTSEWTIRADAERTTREGNRPMGMDFGSAGGATREILEPLSQTLDRVRIAPSFSGETWQAQLSYEYSGFGNEYSSVWADNPTLTASSPTAGSVIGRTALAPSNHAQTVAMSGAMHTGRFSRLAVSASYSWRSQDAAFLPRTSNTAIDTSSFGPLPSSSLGGDVRTAMFNINWSGRLDPKVTLATRFTYFGMNDETPDITFRGRVVTDRSTSAAYVTRDNYSYNRQNASAELSWRPYRYLTARLSDNLQVWNRNDLTREVATTTEHTPKLAIDVMPLDWLTVRTSYRIGTRIGDNWNPVVSPDNSPNVRLYDEANRSLHRFDLGAEFDPLPNTSVGIQSTTTRTRFPSTLYGLSRDDNTLFATDIAWIPNKTFTVTAGAGFQTYWMTLGNQVRSTTYPNTYALTWMTDETDSVVSADLNVNAVVVDKVLDVGVGGMYMRTTTNLHNWNPVTPSGADAASVANAVASDFPQIYFRQVIFSAVARYHIGQEWTVSARYTTEDVKNWDFRTGGLNQAYGGQYYLGDNPPFYGAGYLTFTVSYRPWVPGLRHGLY